MTPPDRSARISPTSRSRRRSIWWLVLVAAGLLLSACGRNMADQPKAEVYEASPFFVDGAAVRPLPDGTVSRNRGGVDPTYFTGQGPDGLVSELPVELTSELLLRGQERFNVYCSACHNYNGDGRGMVVQKGFPQPTSFHAQRLLDQPVGYFFSTITNGFGRMYSYASRVPVEDRWAIAAYVKALQLSQNATVDDVPSEVRGTLLDSTGEVR